MASHNTLGNEGEQKAIKLLQAKGYEILHTNWRKGRYELDIIARLPEELVVVEVKTRSENPLVTPEEAVDRKKIRHIVAATDKYIKTFNIDLSVRFDIIAISGEQMEHIEDAFYPPVFQSGQKY